MTTAHETLIMALVIILFVILLIVLAQLNCFIERRRDDRHRREIQNLKQLRKDQQGRQSNGNSGAVNGSQ